MPVSPSSPARATARCLVVLAAVLLWSACGSAPPVVVLQGGPELNAGGNAATVRVYQLTNDTNFLNTTIEAFWRDDAGALADELVSSESFVLYPDQSETFELDLSDETRYVGVAVDLRQPDRDRWRAVYPVDDLAKRQVVVTVGSDALSTEVR